MEPYKRKEEEIRKMFATLYSSWGKGDAKLYASFFTEDCDYVTFSGDHIKGREANAEIHQELFAGILKGSSLIGEVTSIRFLSEDIAIVHAVGTVQLRWQKKAPARRRSINTNVVVKENGNWRIRAFHNCRIQRPGLLLRLFLALRK